MAIEDRQRTPLELRDALPAAFRAALEASDPHALTRQALPDRRPALVLAAGKGALPMLRAAEDAYPDVPGVAVTETTSAPSRRGRPCPIPPPTPTRSPS